MKIYDLCDYPKGRGLKKERRRRGKNGKRKRGKEKGRLGRGDKGQTERLQEKKGIRKGRGRGGIREKG